MKISNEKFKPKFNFKALIILSCICFPLAIFVLNPEFVGIVWGITVGSMIRKYQIEKKLQRKANLLEILGLKKRETTYVGLYKWRKSKLIEKERFK